MQSRQPFVSSPRAGLSQGALPLRMSREAQMMESHHNVCSDLGANQMVPEPYQHDSLDEMMKTLFDDDSCSRPASAFLPTVIDQEQPVSPSWPRWAVPDSVPSWNGAQYQPQMRLLAVQGPGGRQPAPARRDLGFSSAAGLGTAPATGADDFRNLFEDSNNVDAYYVHHQITTMNSFETLLAFGAFVNSSTGIVEDGEFLASDDEQESEPADFAGAGLATSEQHLPIQAAQEPASAAPAARHGRRPASARQPSRALRRDVSQPSGTCPGCKKHGLSLVFRGKGTADRDNAWMGSHRMPGRRQTKLKGSTRGLHCPYSRDYRRQVEEAGGLQ